MVIPVGRALPADALSAEEAEGKLVSEALQPTLFVPMTGKAEASRAGAARSGQADDRKRRLRECHGRSARPTGWHYQRQLKIVSGKDAREGKNYVTFSNAMPGRDSQALQGFAIDGRRVAQLQLSAWSAARTSAAARTPQQLPAIVISFYDENRATVGEASLGPWRGTFDWRTESKRINVPPKAREAILRIGLLGAVGEISFDQIELKAARR